MNTKQFYDAEDVKRWKATYDRVLGILCRKLASHRKGGTLPRQLAMSYQRAALIALAANEGGKSLAYLRSLT